ncbi:hypothetical protein DFH09DRAFT_1364121 [Mycena vulgaris]|nr:hypothetical protein DFH09DRAFT_1364121 [Mycena vulgaris]
MHSLTQSLLPSWRSGQVSSLYRFVYILCLLQIISSAWTIYEFVFNATGESQMMLILYTAVTIPLVIQLAMSTGSTRTRYSRVYDHMQRIFFLVFSWFLGSTPFETPYLPLFLAARGSETVLSPCAAERFMAARCVPIALDVALPVAICATPRRIMLRARAIHGEENVALPPPLIAAAASGETGSRVGLGQCRGD